MLACRHHTYPRGLPNPWNHQVEGWTGHTVYPYLFPDTQHFAAYLARRGVKLMFNHHHAVGIMFHEGVYPSMAAAVGVDAKTGKTVEFDIANITWADAYFREVSYRLIIPAIQRAIAASYSSCACSSCMGAISPVCSVVPSEPTYRCLSLFPYVCHPPLPLPAHCRSSSRWRTWA